MQQHSSLLTTTLEIRAKRPAMLRGYDPLQEIARWNMIWSLLLGGNDACWLGFHPSLYQFVHFSRYT